LQIFVALVVVVVAAVVVLTLQVIIMLLLLLLLASHSVTCHMAVTGDNEIHEEQWNYNGRTNTTTTIVFTSAVR